MKIFAGKINKGNRKKKIYSCRILNGFLKYRYLPCAWYLNRSSAVLIINGYSEWAKGSWIKNYHKFR